MRNRYPLLLLIALLFSSAGIQAQADRPGVSFKRLFLDYQTLNGGDFGAFRDYSDGLEFSFLYPVNDRLRIDVPVKIGLADRRAEVSSSLWGIDVHANYDLLTRKDHRLVPYALAGIGAVLENKDSIHAQIPLGAGLDLRIAPYAYITFQSELRIALKEDKNNFNHSVGFKYFFGRAEEEVVIPPPPADTDGDGVLDEVDKCPLVAGLAAFDGCPDIDNDGIQDAEDACPEVPGLLELQGCPDSDGDGISDKDDECPNTPGTLANRGCPEDADRDGDGIVDEKDKCPDVAGTIDGCPDTDGDGIIDDEDRCPTIRGELRYQGCPDTDGDGIDDLTDRCPTMAGPADNGGCPHIEKEDKETLELAMRAVQFEHSSARLKPESNRILNQVAQIMRKYPDYRLEINGHTDNTGADTYNQKLSEQRARACYDYLVAQGIHIKRMSFKGYGESKPIADNDTLTGRQLNRRVEFNLFPGK